MASSAACGWAAAYCAAANAAYLSSIQGGDLGDMVKAAVISYVTAQAFNFVGSETSGHIAKNGLYGGKYTREAYIQSDWFVANVAGHAVVGCASAAASGDNCKSGALAAGFGALAGPTIPTKGFEAGLVKSMVVGGLGSKLGGGKFENGAITGAFGYIFNTCASNPSSCLNPGDKGPGMVDMAVGDGKWKYVPAGQAAADAFTDAALYTDVAQSSAPVNDYWIVGLEITAGFVVAPEAIMGVVKDLPYARSLFCAFAMCGALSSPGGVDAVINTEAKILREVTTRRRIEYIPSPSKVNGASVP